MISSLVINFLIMIKLKIESKSKWFESNETMWNENRKITFSILFHIRKIIIYIINQQKNLNITK